MMIDLSKAEGVSALVEQLGANPQDTLLIAGGALIVQDLEERRRTERTVINDVVESAGLAALRAALDGPGHTAFGNRLQ